MSKRFYVYTADPVVYGLDEDIDDYGGEEFGGVIELTDEEAADWSRVVSEHAAWQFRLGNFKEQA